MNLRIKPIELFQGKLLENAASSREKSLPFSFFKVCPRQGQNISPLCSFSI
jgi:hypothetical protein